MIINYNKTIADKSELKPFLTEKKPEYYPYMEKGTDIVDWEYDSSGLTKALVTRMEEALKDGNTVLRTANNKIWVSAPEAFAAGIKSEPRTEYSHWEYKKDRLENVGKRTKHGLIWDKNIPIYEIKPILDIWGTVAFERLEGVDPTPVLNMLKEQGYAAEVVPTSQELEEAAKRMKAARKARSSDTTFRSRDNDDDSGIGTIVAAAFLGF